MKKLFAAASALCQKAVHAVTGSTQKVATVVVGGVSLVAATSASAAYTLPAPVTAAFTAMGEAWAAIEAQLWPILTVVVIGFFVVKMFKKGANKVG
jgi:polysaccharide deacetylase 2 family uncharacterized protein YibQ